MSPPVVHVLEVVEVEDRDRRWPPDAAGLGQGALEVLGEHAPVGEAGEWVGPREGALVGVGPGEAPDEPCHDGEDREPHAGVPRGDPGARGEVLED